MNEEIENSNEEQSQAIEKLRERRAFIGEWRNKQVEEFFKYPPILPESYDNNE